MNAKTVVDGIAKKHLRIPTLVAQGRDSLDFHELGVWNIEAALQAAYRAGQVASAQSIARSLASADARTVNGVLDWFVSADDSPAFSEEDGAVAKHLFDKLSTMRPECAKPLAQGDSE